MANKKQLVFEHLEDVSWRVLKEYPQIVRGLLKGRAGVYALYSKSKLYYVGLASNLMPRLNQHLGDRHAPKWDRFSVYLTVRSEHIKELESLLLRIVKPKGNTQSGKFAKSKRLNNQLNREMTEEDKDRRARLLGGKVARRGGQVALSRSKVAPCGD